MNRYKILFNKLNLKHEGAFIPFLMLGDPNLDISLEIIDLIIESGADALELGIPFSDPLADGLIIQKSVIRALNNNVNINKCFNLLFKIRNKHKYIPIGILIYSNLVFNYGIKNFYNVCSKLEIDSVLLADVPIEASEEFVKYAKQYKVSPIFICPPNSNNSFLKKIVSYNTSYIYLLSRSGTTGIENKKFSKINHLVNSLKKYNSSPIIQGFGISQPNQVIKALSIGVSGIISGSAIINIIEKNIKNKKLMFNILSIFTKSMKQATLNIRQGYSKI